VAVDHRNLPQRPATETCRHTALFASTEGGRARSLSAVSETLRPTALSGMNRVRRTGEENAARGFITLGGRRPMGRGICARDRVCLRWLVRKRSERMMGCRCAVLRYAGDEAPMPILRAACRVVVQCAAAKWNGGFVGSIKKEAFPPLPSSRFRHRQIPCDNVPAFNRSSPASPSEARRVMACGRRASFFIDPTKPLAAAGDLRKGHFRVQRMGSITLSHRP
jgi:hypothetical protein